MENNKTSISRSRFLKWTAGVLASFTAIRYFSTKPEPQPEASGDGKTVRMLGEDGKLVEIDASMIAAKKGKVSSEELLAWVKK